MHSINIGITLINQMSFDLFFVFSCDLANMVIVNQNGVVFGLISYICH